MSVRVRREGAPNNSRGGCGPRKFNSIVPAQWIQKGKQRPNVELGHRLMIATVQNQLIQGYAVLMQEAEVERE